MSRKSERKEEEQEQQRRSSRTKKAKPFFDEPKEAPRKPSQELENALSEWGESLDSLWLGEFAKSHIRPFLRNEVSLEDVMAALRPVWTRFVALRRLVAKDLDETCSLDHFLDLCREIPAVHNCVVVGAVSLEEAQASIAEHGTIREQRKRELNKFSPLLSTEMLREFIWAFDFSVLRSAILETILGRKNGLVEAWKDYVDEKLINLVGSDKSAQERLVKSWKTFEELDPAEDGLVMQLFVGYVLGCVEKAKFDAVAALVRRCSRLLKLNRFNLEKIWRKVVVCGLLKPDYNAEGVVAFSQRLERCFAKCTENASVLKRIERDGGVLELCFGIDEDELQLRLDCLHRCLHRLTQKQRFWQITEQLSKDCVSRSRGVEDWNTILNRMEDLDLLGVPRFFMEGVDERVRDYVLNGSKESRTWLERLTSAISLIKPPLQLPRSWDSKFLAVADSDESQIVFIERQCKMALDACNKGFEFWRYGQHGCRLACLTLIAIRKFREDQFLRPLDKNVVLLIAKMVFKSRHDRLWAFEAQLVKGFKFFKVACKFCADLQSKSVSLHSCPQGGKQCLGCRSTSGWRCPFHCCASCCQYKSCPQHDFKSFGSQ